MDLWERELYIAQIMSGRFDLTIKNDEQQIEVSVFAPSIQVKVAANHLFRESLTEANFAGLLTEQEALDILIENDLWGEKEENNLEQFNKDVDQLKVKIFEFFFKSQEKAVARELLSRARKEQLRLFNLRHSFDFFTAECFAQSVKLKYIISSSIKYPDGSSYESPELIINSVMSALSENRLDEKEFREIARSDPWRTMWGCSKRADIFGKPIPEWSDDQRALVCFSQMYDNIYEHSECPRDEIIEDDDSLDGWFIVQKRKRGEEQNKSDIDSKLGKNANAQEVYIPVNTIEDAQKVHTANSGMAAQKIRQRQQFLKENKRAAEQSLPDVKRDINMQRAAAYAEAMRSRKG